MSIQTNNHPEPQLYKRHNRCFVSFPYDVKLVDTVRRMKNRWWTPKTREWSFDGACYDEFLAAHPTTINLEYDMFIYKTKMNIYFKFIATHDLAALSKAVGTNGEVEYDPDGHVFVIPATDYYLLEDYVAETGLHALMRNFEQSCSIKRKV
jgi:hypothetical protein